MALIKQPKTRVVRTHPNFEKLIKDIQVKKFQQQKKMVKSSRITLAIFNQYKKYPELLEELRRAELK
jgi:hypothetical protein